MPSTAKKLLPLQRSRRLFQRALVFVVALQVLVVSASHAQGKPDSAIRAVLEEQVAAWNRGDIEGYMRGYRASDSTDFVSGGTRVVGFTTVLERYRKHYATREAMGVLSFEDLRVRMLSPSAALADGVWRLKRQKDEPWGRFSLILEQDPAGWRITHDHTSSAE